MSVCFSVSVCMDTFRQNKAFRGFFAIPVVMAVKPSDGSISSYIIWTFTRYFLTKRGSRLRHVQLIPPSWMFSYILITSGEVFIHCAVMNHVMDSYRQRHMFMAHISSLLHQKLSDIDQHLSWTEEIYHLPFGHDENDLYLIYNWLILRGTFDLMHATTTRNMFASWDLEASVSVQQQNVVVRSA